MKSNRRALAEQIAAVRGIKVKSAMRYLQRSVATGEKQQIKSPRLTDLPQKVRQAAAQHIEKHKPLPVRPARPARPALSDDSDSSDYGVRKNLGAYQKGNFHIFSVTGEWKISKKTEKRAIRFYLSPGESAEAMEASKQGALLDYLYALPDSKFLSGGGAAVSVSRVDITSSYR